jgi:HK97 gp10 family phage protein
MKVFKSDLSYDGLDKLIGELKDYKESLNDKCNEIVRQLEEMGVERARSLCPVDKGDARDSIVGYMDETNHSATIIAGSHCIYIEFGTGVVGGNSSHPSPEWLAFMSWAYGSGGTIFTTKDGRTGWYYPADDGTWRFTEGMESRPFMYETVQYLKKQSGNVAKGVFKS